MLVGGLPVTREQVSSELWCERDKQLHQNFKITGGEGEMGEIMKYHVSYY